MSVTLSQICLEHAPHQTRRNDSLDKWSRDVVQTLYDEPWNYRNIWCKGRIQFQCVKTNLSTVGLRQTTWTKWFFFMFVSASLHNDQIGFHPSSTSRYKTQSTNTFTIYADEDCRYKMHLQGRYFRISECSVEWPVWNLIHGWMSAADWLTL